jgi:hypothetical protein
VVLGPTRFHQQTEIQTCGTATNAYDVHHILQIYFETEYFNIEINICEKSTAVKSDIDGFRNKKSPHKGGLVACDEKSLLFGVVARDAFYFVLRA